MNKSLKMILVLTIITIISGSILSYWDSFTKPIINEYKSNKLDKLILEILPEHNSIEELKLGEYNLYIGKLDEKIVGIAFKVEGSGYQDIISMIVGVTPDFSKITALKILSQKETPGLGTKIVEDPSNKNPSWFTEQFKDVKVEPEIIYVKNAKPSKDNEIQAITGATISSKSVVNILNTNIGKVKKMYNEK
ncbi:MAG: FMN-binding protein [Candidatus Marinimicrobia bacterium]|nr:FMN-binding protein [Candidatus Neomarinimicrobiota bacterium]